MLQRGLLGLALALAPACTSSSSDSDPAEGIVNGTAAAAATTYWKSQQGCLVSYGGGFCSTEFEFSIGADGSARWQEGTGGSGCGGKGEGTWTKIGPAVIALNNVCNGSSLTMTTIEGAVGDGFFTADVSGYHANRFTIQTGNVPGF
jgi:hypothetical protein